MQFVAHLQHHLFLFNKYIFFPKIIYTTLYYPYETFFQMMQFFSNQYKK